MTQVFSHVQGMQRTICSSIYSIQGHMPVSKETAQNILFVNAYEFEMQVSQRMMQESKQCPLLNHTTCPTSFCIQGGYICYSQESEYTRYPIATLSVHRINNLNVLRWKTSKCYVINIACSISYIRAWFICRHKDKIYSTKAQCDDDQYGLIMSIPPNVCI